MPAFDSRLKAFKFSKTYKELSSELNENLEKFNYLYKYLRESPKMTIVMKYLLAIGNYMNGTGFRGGAFGFKLDILGKTSEVKDFTNKKTLTHFLVQTL